MAGRDEGRARVPRGLRRTARRELSARLDTNLADVIVAGADIEYPAVAAGVSNTGRGARHLLRIGAYAVALHRTLVEYGVGGEAATVLASDVVFAAIRPGRDAPCRLHGFGTVTATVAHRGLRAWPGASTTPSQIGR